MKYIDKSAAVAEIEKVIDEPAPSHDQQCPWEDGYYCGLYKAESIIDTLEVKEVDLEKEWKEFLKDGDVGFKEIAKHFFELGMQVNNPVTAADRGMVEEIIINLKRVENDYLIDLTREMEWLRNITQKGE